MADEPTDAAARATADANAAAGNAADAMRSGAEQAKSAFQENVADPARRAGEAMKASGQKIVEGGSTVSTKLIDQAESNAREAFAAMRAAASAKDVSDLMRIQGDYLREQSQRSMAQAREIGELIMQFGRDAMAPMRGSGGQFGG